MTYDPYALAFPAPAFSLASPDFTEGDALPAECWAPPRGAGLSPALTWTDPPAGTRSLVLTGFDPDAPIPGGLWHWIVKDIPATAEGLARGAGTDSVTGLPGDAVALVNDLGRTGYSGVNPPPGTGTHRLVICATALSVPALELPPGASPALLHIAMIEHTLGRALLTGTSSAPA